MEDARVAQATAGARPAPQPALERALAEAPTSFDFYQAVRLLERLRPGRAPVGEFADPGAEAVRFATSLRLGFPASEVESLATGDDRALLTATFFGLTGPSGVMPLEYSALVADRARAKDPTMHDFLDLLNHRMLSLLYRAWERARFVVAYERDRRDALTRHLFDLVGLGTAGLDGRLPLPDESLLRYAGLLALPTRPAVALEGLLADYFQVPASVEQFIGSWFPIEGDALCRLDDGGAATSLGGGAVAGDEVWDCQGRVRVRLGPLSRAQYDRFLPDGDAHAPLRALVRLYTRDELDAEVQLVLSPDEVPGLTLGGDAAPLGWATWIRTEARAREGDEMVMGL